MGQTQHQGAQRCENCDHLNTAAAQFCHQCGQALTTIAQPEAQDEDPLLGLELMDRYTIRRLLGVGGMGRVYVADQKLGEASREVAIKTLLPEYSRDKDIQQRFRRESSTVIALSHPNTIQFFDFGEMDDGTLFIVMEYIKGESLAHALLRGPIEPSRVDRLLIQICGSLAEAHQMGIVHRDLKPENVLLTSAGGQADYVKVLDFGIAKRSDVADERDTKLTQQGTVLGTPPYMSPEQFNGTVLDARSDIYSLGLMVYEMLTGELPFTARTPWEWATKHLTEAPADLGTHAIAGGLPQNKIAAVMRALHKDRDERFESATDFLRTFVGIEDTQSAWALATSTSTGGALPNQIVEGQAGAVGTSNTPRGLVTTGEQFSATAMFGARPRPWVPMIIGAVVLGVLAGLGGYFFLGSDKPEMTAAVVNKAASEEGLPASDGIPLIPVGLDSIGLPDAAIVKATDAAAPVDQATTVQTDSDDGKASRRQKKKTSSKRSRKSRVKPKPVEATPVEPTPVRRQPVRRVVVAKEPANSAPPEIVAVEDALRRNTLTGAVEAWKRARAAHPQHPSLAGLKRRIGTKGSNKVGVLLQQQRCTPAQTLYRSLQQIGADRSARTHFSNDWCPAK